MSEGRRWRATTAAALAALAAVAWTGAAPRAQQAVAAGGAGPLRTSEGQLSGQLPAPPTPDDSKSAAAQAVIDRHCARCHNDPPGGGAASPARALALAEAAGDPTLVRPGNPDASRLYLMMLRRLKPPDLATPSPERPEPDAEELHKVREWIEALPPSPVAVCPERSRARPAETAALAQVVAAAGAQAVRHRFVTLAHLHDACVPDERLDALRDAVGPLLQLLADTPARVVTEPVESTRSLLRIDLAQAVIDPATWERIVTDDSESPAAPGSADGDIREATGTAHPVLRVDRLAQAVLAADGGAARLPDRLVRPVRELADEFRRPVHLLRAAAELGVGPDALTRLADADRGAAGELARRLVQGVVSRPEMERSAPLLAAALAAPPSTPSPRPPTPDSQAVAQPAEALPPLPLDPGPAIALTSERITYRVGDRLRLSVRTSADCHVMLISLDRRGRATVLYPNDFEATTLLPAGRELKVPADGAGYAFRLAEPGTERIVALCSTGSPAIDGITHDLERQRFTDLGDYGTFLMQAVTAEAAQRKAGAETADPPPVRPTRRWRLPRRAGTEPTRPRADQVARTAISIEVQPASVPAARP